jgi:Ulp1 family protease
MFPPPGNIIFLPINDRYADASGGGIGSHWSLLVVTDGKTPSKIRARHYDSLSAQNEKAARRVWKKYSALIGAKEGSSEEGLEEANELQAQDNACDCGLYGLVLAERMLLSRGSAAHSIGKMVAKKVSPKHVEKFREELRKWLVQKWLRFDVEEQERWKSWEDVVQHVGDMPRVDV